MAYIIPKGDLNAEDNKTLYQYGSMLILTKGDKVVWIKNRVRINPNWKFDQEKYDRLNEELLINHLENIN